jgi:hypothetical protein
MAVDSQTSATTPAAAPTQPPGEPGGPAGEPDASPEHAGFGSRGRLRRRARFLRKARELAYRDLGGLVFSLHRFGQRNDELVLAKLATLSRIDAELRALEDTLAERQPVTVLREAGITACPRCAAIHSGEDRFCPSCGLPMSRRSDLPIAGAAAAGTVQAPAPAQAAPAAPAPSAAQPFAAAPSAQAPTPPPGAAAAPGGAPPAQAAPATQQHPALAPQPAAPAAKPHAAPQPATQAFDAVPSGAAGRSPLPPRQAPAPTPGEEDQPTEIIRPRAPGS